MIMYIYIKINPLGSNTINICMLTKYLNYYILGNTFTWADICMYTMTAHLKMNGAGNFM